MKLDINAIGEQVLRFMETETAEEKPKHTLSKVRKPSKCRYCGSELNLAVDTCGFCEAKQ